MSNRDYGEELPLSIYLSVLTYYQLSSCPVLLVFLPLLLQIGGTVEQEFQQVIVSAFARR